MITGSPLVDHFELDALGLDGPSEAAVATVDAELELLLEFCAGKEGRRSGWERAWAFTVRACCVCMLTGGGGVFYSTTSVSLTGGHAPRGPQALAAPPDRGRECGSVGLSGMLLCRL